MTKTLLRFLTYLSIYIGIPLGIPALYVPAQAQSSPLGGFGTVTGNVRDESNSPLIQATVKAKNSATSQPLVTITDAKGNFRFSKLPEGSYTFSISFFGYKPKVLTGYQVKQAQPISISVKMELSSKALGEVVIVGYGKQSKKLVTGSIATVQGSVINNLPVSNVSNTLAGRAAGVIVSAPSGVPGVGSTINVRGVTSYRGQDPLYVIDDIPREKADFDLIAPSDIQSISILKDGAAAIYGVRGGSGVILVTTKHGTIGKAKLTISANFGIAQPTKVPKRLNPYQDALYRNNFFLNQKVPAGDPSYYNADELAYFKHVPYNPDNFDLITKTPYTTNINLSASGGSPNMKYYIATGYYNESALFKKVNSARYNVLSNLDAKIARDLSVSLSLQAAIKPNESPWWSDGVSSNTLSDLTRTSLNYTPLGPSYINGLPVGNLYHLQTNEIINNGGDIKNNASYLNGFLKLSYTPEKIKGFGIDAYYNYNMLFNVQKIRYLPYTLYLFNTQGTNGHLLGNTVTGSTIASQRAYDFYEQDHLQQRTYVFNASAHYNRSFKDHYLELSVFYEQSENSKDSTVTRGENLLSRNIDQLFAADPDPNRRFLNGVASEGGRESVFGRLNYRFKNKYLFEGILRADASSAFGSKNKWGAFPSASLGWIVSEEPFMKKLLPNFDNLKLRASYGKLGYDNIPLSQYFPYYTVASVAVFDRPVNTILPSRYPNPDIKWQKIGTLNIGLDASYRNGLISGSIDYYFKKTSDLLVPNPTTIPTTFGAQLADVNFGQVNANGIELTLQHNNQLGAFKYSVGLNFSYGTNKVIKFPEQSGIPDYQRRTGRPVYFTTGFISNGIIRNEADLAKYKNITINNRPFELGDIGFQDVNKDGQINSLDSVVLSKKAADPRISYGIPISASWKGFYVNILLQGVGNREVMISDRSQWQEQNVLSFWSDFWTPENVQAKFPKIGGLNATQDVKSSFWLRNGSYLRFKTLELGYSLPASVNKHLGLASCRFSVVANNLLMIHDSIHYYDAEYQTDQTGYGAFQYPIMRSVTFGLNVGF